MFEVVVDADEDVDVPVGDEGAAGALVAGKDGPSSTRVASPLASPLPPLDGLGVSISVVSLGFCASGGLPDGLGGCELGIGLFVAGFLGPIASSLVLSSDFGCIRSSKPSLNLTRGPS